MMISGEHELFMLLLTSCELVLVVDDVTHSLSHTHIQSLDQSELRHFLGKLLIGQRQLT